LTGTDRQAAFQAAYRDHVWLGDSRSGPGSDEASTRSYREVLNAVLRDRNVRSVVDLGCGDWASTRLIDWNGASYLGIDIVPEVVAANQERYGAPGVAFRVGDFVRDPVPAADLLVSKEALQHLPTADVHAVLARLPSFRFALITNDVAGQLRAPWRRLRRWEPVGTLNDDIAAGSWRPLDLRAPPFSLDATIVHRYETAYAERRWVKEVLLWENLDPATAPG